MTDNVPDEIGTLEGFRVFRLSIPSYAVRSYSETSFRWQKGPNEAVCSSFHTTTVLKNSPDGPVQVEVLQHTDIPDPSCGCGFWVYKTEDVLRQKIMGGMFGSQWSKSSRQPRKGRIAPTPTLYPGYGDFSGSEREIVFIGKVKAWGKIIEGTDGFRTEFCELVSVFPLLDEEIEYLKALANMFEIDVDMSMHQKGTEKKVEKEQQFSCIILDLGPLILGRYGRYRPQEMNLSILGDGHGKTSAPLKDSRAGKWWKLREMMDDLTKIITVQIWNDLALKYAVQDLIDNKKEVVVTVEENYYAPANQTSLMVTKIEGR